MSTLIESIIRNGNKLSTTQCETMSVVCVTDGFSFSNSSFDYVYRDEKLVSLCAYAFFTFYVKLLVRTFLRSRKLSFAAIWPRITLSEKCNALLNAIEATQITQIQRSCNPNSSMLDRTKLWFTTTFWWRIGKFERICIICYFAISSINILRRYRSSAWFVKH